MEKELQITQYKNIDKMGVKALALALHTPCYGREGKGEGGHFLLMIFNLFPVVSCTKKMLCEQHGQLYILLVNIKIKKSLNRTRCVCGWGGVGGERHLYLLPLN